MRIRRHGLIITTGSFTRGAKAEAHRDGVPPIELVDAETIVMLFEKNELGLVPVKTYTVNLDFFKQYQDDS